MPTKLEVDKREQAYALLMDDANKILNLIEVQIENLTMPQCPLYEEVLDTQMFGLQREIDFAIRLNLITEEEGKEIKTYRSEEHTSELQSRGHIVCRLLLEKKK